MANYTGSRRRSLVARAWKSSWLNAERPEASVGKVNWRREQKQRRGLANYTGEIGLGNAAGGTGKDKNQAWVK